MISSNVQSSHEIVVNADNTFIITQHNIWGSNITTSQYKGYDITQELKEFMEKHKFSKRIDDIQNELKFLLIKTISDMREINNIFLLVIDDKVICYLNTPLAIDIVQEIPTYIRSLIQYTQDYFKCTEYTVKNIYTSNEIESELPNISIDNLDRSLYITI